MRKITEQGRIKRRERPARERERARNGVRHDASARAEVRAAHKAIKALEGKLARERALNANLDDRRAPLDLDHFVSASGTLSRSKRQEYNSHQGRFADMLRSPDKFSDTEIKKIARYQAGLAEDEARFVSRRAARLTSIQSAREDLFLRNFVARAIPLFTGKITPSGFALKHSRKTADRILNLHLSDLHIGSKLDGQENPRKSDATSEARRLGMLALETAEFKTQYRERTALNVYLNGDIIEGLLGHSQADDTDPLTAQFTRALHMLAQALGFLAKHFPQVRVYCQSGNHGRNIQVHPGRATSQKWDSFETMIYVGLKCACSALPNVRFDIPKTPYCAVPLFDSTAIVTHGDTTINVGNPAKGVNVASIVAQINAINASQVYGHSFDLVLTGHVHTAMALHFPGGMLLVNGAATPPGGFAQSLGYYDACAQWLFESVRGYAVGDMRLLRLDARVDADASYERVVSPIPFDC